MKNNLKKLMTEFCDIVMPGHDKARGYINVRKKVQMLNVDARTYYNWKNFESVPRLPQMLEKLEQKGYTLEIVPKKDVYK